MVPSTDERGSGIEASSFPPVFQMEANSADFSEDWLNNDHCWSEIWQLQPAVRTAWKKEHRGWCGTIYIPELISDMFEQYE